MRTKSENLQRKLLSENSSSFNEACIIAQAIEMTEKRSSKIPEDHKVNDSISHQSVSPLSLDIDIHSRRTHNFHAKTGYNEGNLKAKCYRCSKLQM